MTPAEKCPKVRIEPEGVWDDVIGAPKWWEAREHAESAAKDHLSSRDSAKVDCELNVQVWLDGGVTRWLVRVRTSMIFEAEKLSSRAHGARVLARKIKTSNAWITICQNAALHENGTFSMRARSRAPV